MDVDKSALSAAKDKEDVAEKDVPKHLQKWKVLAGIAVLVLTFASGLGGQVTAALKAFVNKQVAQVEEAQRTTKLLDQQAQILERLAKEDAKIVELQQQVSLLQKQGAIDAEEYERMRKRMETMESENVLGKEERLILRGQISTIEKSDVVQTQIITSTLGNLFRQPR